MTALVAGFVLLPGSPAAAQSLLQSIFGFFNAGAPKKVSPRRPEPQKAIPWVGSREDREDIARSKRPDAKANGKSGPWRTMCVRLCDGYYFPVSRGVSSARFDDDAKTCRARCGVPARLFYLDKESDDIAAMVDLNGREYGELKTAFRYRKRLTDGCTCRPMPWSAAEQARHKRYEVYDAYMKLQEERDAEAERRAEARILELAEERREREAVENRSQSELREDTAAVPPFPTARDSDVPVSPASHEIDKSSHDDMAALAKMRADRRATRPRAPRRSTSQRSAQTRRPKPEPASGLGALFAPQPSPFGWPGDR